MTSKFFQMKSAPLPTRIPASDVKSASRGLSGPLRGGIAFLITFATASSVLAQSQARAIEPKSPTPRTADGEAQRLASFTQRLRAQYPQTRIDEVRRTETPGLFEVVMGPNVAYIESSGRYWYFGHRYDMLERKDLTAPRIAEAARVDVATLPTEHALKEVRGTGRRIVYVFADPNCGYCKQLERTLAHVQDLTVYTYPLPILSQDSVDKAAAIWCSPDRNAAWKAWMLDNQPPAAASNCATPIDQITQLARRHRIDATPTLVAVDGRKLPGAVSAAELTAWLDARTSGTTATVKTSATVR